MYVVYIYIYVYVNIYIHNIYMCVHRCRSSSSPEPGSRYSELIGPPDVRPANTLPIQPWRGSHRDLLAGAFLGKFPRCLLRMCQRTAMDFSKVAWYWWYLMLFDDIWWYCVVISMWSVIMQVFSHCARIIWTQIQRTLSNLHDYFSVFVDVRPRAEGSDKKTNAIPSQLRAICCISG